MSLQKQKNLVTYLKAFQSYQVAKIFLGHTKDTHTDIQTDRQHPPCQNIVCQGIVNSITAKKNKKKKQIKLSSLCLVSGFI